MLRRSNIAFNVKPNFRSRKRWPYMVHHNKLPWNTVEPGTELSHKILAPCFLRLIQSASMMHINGLVMNSSNSGTSNLPNIPEDQWLFALPASTFVVPVSNTSSDAKKLVITDEDEDEEKVESKASSLAPYEWFGKRVVDEMCLTHYGPIAATVAPVLEVAEFRSPDLRIICNAIRLGNFYDSFQIHSKSSLAASRSTTTTTNNKNSSSNLCVYHFYRPNRAPSEMESAFKQFLRSTIERPDLSALEEVVAQGAAFKPTTTRKVSGNASASASPMPQISVPTSPQYGLIEREAIRPGDTFGCRSRVWGHFW